jgi:hypothetical protein
MQNTAQIQVLTRDNVQIKQTLGELLGAMQQLQASQSQLKSHSDDLQTENSRQIM